MAPFKVRHLSPRRSRRGDGPVTMWVTRGCAARAPAPAKRRPWCRAWVKVKVVAKRRCLGTATGHGCGRPARSALRDASQRARKVEGVPPQGAKEGTGRIYRRAPARPSPAHCRFSGLNHPLPSLSGLSSALNQLATGLSDASAAFGSAILTGSSSNSLSR